jgi:molybdopterin-binding protein
LAAYVEITIEQGANLTSTVTVNDTQGDSVNLSTYSASAQLRKSYYSSSANTLTATITGNANGQITLSMTAANTSNLTPGRYVYDLIIRNTIDNSVTRVVEGTAVVLPSVTR